MKSIIFKESVKLLLERKTDDSEIMLVTFFKNEVVSVEGWAPTNDNSTERFDIFFKRENGWVARGVHRSVFRENFGENGGVKPCGTKSGTKGTKTLGTKSGKARKPRKTAK